MTDAANMISVDWNNMTGIHVGGPYYLGVKFLPLFKKSEDPSICNITSLGAFFLNRSVNRGPTF